MDEYGNYNINQSEENLNERAVPAGVNAFRSTSYIDGVPTPEVSSSDVWGSNPDAKEPPTPVDPEPERVNDINAVPAGVNAFRSTSYIGDVPTPEVSSSDVWGLNSDENEIPIPDESKLTSPDFNPEESTESDDEMSVLDIDLSSFGQNPEELEPAPMTTMPDSTPEELESVPMPTMLDSTPEELEPTPTPTMPDLNPEEPSVEEEHVPEVDDNSDSYETTIGLDTEPLMPEINIRESETEVPSLDEPSDAPEMLEPIEEDEPDLEVPDDGSEMLEPTEEEDKSDLEVPKDVPKMLDTNEDEMKIPVSDAPTPAEALAEPTMDKAPLIEDKPEEVPNVGSDEYPAYVDGRYSVAIRDAIQSIIRGSISNDEFARRVLNAVLDYNVGMREHVEHLYNLNQEENALVDFGDDIEAQLEVQHRLNEKLEEYNNEMTERQRRANLIQQLEEERQRTQMLQQQKRELEERENAESVDNVGITR